MALVTENGKAVLILVVMEYTQWDWKVLAPEYPISRLNPCCNGIYSMRIGWFIGANDCLSLNPCCNGIYSMRKSTNYESKTIRGLNPCCNGIYSMSCLFLLCVVRYLVLILVVMEYTQWVCKNVLIVSTKQVVLILVVMEYTQWGFSNSYVAVFDLCLNPCCNGIYSMRAKTYISFV